MRGCGPHIGLANLRSPVSTRATTSKSPRIGPRIRRLEFRGSALRGACAGLAQSQHSYSAAPPSWTARRRANFAHGTFQEAPRAVPQLSDSGHHFRRGAARPDKSQQAAPGTMAIFENAIVLQRKVAGHCSQPIGAFHVIDMIQGVRLGS